MSSELLFEIVVLLIGTSATSLGALWYFQRVRLERPPIGVFNGRDVFIVLTFIIALPLLYLILPSIVLTGFLVLTFSSALYVTFRGVIPPKYLWFLIAGVLGLNIIVAYTLLGAAFGLQLYWLLNSVVALCASIGIANLYVQGGMRMRNVAMFAVLLAFYDGIFEFIIPITQKLADRFEGMPLDPSIGFAWGGNNANIGLGDLLIYALFTIAAYKGFGRRGFTVAFPVIIVFGALMPSFAPLVIQSVTRSGIGIVVPAQIFFGPAALVSYLWLARQAPERSMREWYRAQAIAQQQAKEANASVGGMAKVIAE